MIATTIKGIYLDHIERGIKTVEYRACSEFWKKRIEGKHHGAILFISGRRCKAFKIAQIEIIETPSALRELIPTEKCFAIHLGGLIHGREN